MGLENNFMAYFHWSLEVKIITFIILGILGVTIFFVLRDNHQLYMKFLICALIIVPTIISACFMPRYVKINNDALIIKKMCGQISIPLDNITNVKSVSAKIVSGSIRTFGSGGFFGYLGNFHNSDIGNFSMYVTEKKDLILITTKTKKYIINCGESDMIINYIETHNKVGLSSKNR